ncbi:hypothetical protein SK854_27485 [Lentzea sp. BCCO 10_0061]|uniref:Uncharacterized protein n=1 Tax=Lentzea sokolovensis TaxID=3095429 RepID=A0ABU4V4S6_9PSEU|nr:hypothetical protein [Lentzea sp. BCCO 10_0061]MDX8145880.1 hypothetical protein [Lentzea sp. BCCO 10_0061]
MDHPHGGFDTAEGVSVWVVVVRLALLLVSALIAGSGLAVTVPKGVRAANFALAAVAAGLITVSLVAFDAHVLGAVAHGVLVALVPVLLGKPAVRWVAAALTLLLVIETSVGDSGLLLVANTVYVAGAVAWVALALTPGARFRQHALSLGVVLALAGLVRLVSSGLAFDRRIYETVLGLGLVVVVLLPLAALGIRRCGTLAVVASLLAWSGLAAIPSPQELPIPGVPVLASAGGVPVLISPHRPGPNLVHFPSGNHRVKVGDGPEIAAVPSAGADGTWALVDLPAGRGEIRVNDDFGVSFDTGTAPGPAADVECASAALGGLASGRRDVLTSCPADELSTEDADSLTKLVTFLKNKGVTSVKLVEDGTPRGVRAAALVRSSLPVSDSGDALVVLSGWSDGYRALSRAGVEQAESPVHPHGLYVAPWLLTAPIATSVTTLAVPLRFDPREQLPIGYAIEVGNEFGGTNPTPAGFRSWLGGRSAGDQVQIYAVAQVTAMPMGPGEAHGPGMPMQEELAGQWVPKATVVPVSPVLS